MRRAGVSWAADPDVYYVWLTSAISVFLNLDDLRRP